MQTVLSMRNICKSYYIGTGELKVLKNVNLSIEKGDFLSILGPSGSGKSTLMNIIGCLDTPTSGEYILSGRIGLSSDNPDDEIRARDSMQEKLSLADRFGITIIFSSPIKNEYVTIVNKMAEEENLEIEPEVLNKKAMQWEMMYNGMSPRTARQFINWIKAEMKYGNKS